jgi:hypothetical protein
MSEIVIVNLSEPVPTPESVPLTPAQEAERVTSAQVEASQQTTAQTARVNRSTVETNLIADLAAMQAIIDDTNANINANPAARIKEMARMMRRLGRQALRSFEGTD